MTTDWFRVLSDLQRCGVSLRKVASRVGVTRWRIYEVWRGATPDLRHADGESVLELWAKHTQRSKDEAPKL
jgi:hypothetical protein